MAVQPTAGHSAFCGLHRGKLRCRPRSRWISRICLLQRSLRADVPLPPPSGDDASVAELPPPAGTSPNRGGERRRQPEQHEQQDQKAYGADRSIIGTAIAVKSRAAQQQEDDDQPNYEPPPHGGTSLQPSFLQVSCMDDPTGVMYGRRADWPRGAARAAVLDCASAGYRIGGLRGGGLTGGTVVVVVNGSGRAATGSTRRSGRSARRRSSDPSWPGRAA